MPTDQERADTASNADKAVRRIKELRVQSSAGQGDPSVGGEKRAYELACVVQEYFRQIDSAHIKLLTYSEHKLLESAANDCSSMIMSIMGVNRNDPNAGRDYVNKLSTLADLYDNARKSTLHIITASLLSSAGLQGTASKLTAFHNESKSRVETTEQNLKKIVADAEAALAKVQEIGGRVVVGKQAQYFNKAGSSHALLAGVWTATAASLAVVLISVAFLSMFVHKLMPSFNPASNFEIVQYTLGKVLVCSTIGFFVVASAKIAAGHRHNAVVNKHRSNALNTYKVLVDAAGSNAQDIVLTKAAESIFDPQPSGFGKSESGDLGVSSIVSLAPKIGTDTKP